MKNRNTRRGFTLIELLVVVLIIGILAAVALPQYQVAVWKSRVTQAFVRAKTIYDAEQVYYVANGIFTPLLEELDVDFPECVLDEEQPETYPLYTCAHTDKLGISAPTTIYSSTTNKQGDFVQIEYRLDSPVKRCATNFAVGKKVCQNMGGVEYRNIAPFTFYNLSL